MNEGPGEIKRGRGRPRTLDRKISKGSKGGLTDDFTRITLILKEDHLASLRDLSSKAHLPLKKVIEIVLAASLQNKKVIGEVFNAGYKVDDYFTVEEFSNLCLVSPITIRSYISSGDLSAKKVGKEWFIAISPGTASVVAALIKDRVTQWEQQFERDGTDEDSVHIFFEDQRDFVKKNWGEMQRKLSSLTLAELPKSDLPKALGQWGQLINLSTDQLESLIGKKEEQTTDQIK